MTGKWKRIFFVLVGLVILALVLRKLHEPNHRPVVGVILSESGAADFIGKPERSIIVALQNDRVNVHDPHLGVTYDLQYFDSGSDPKKALQIFETLLKNDNLIAVIGPSTSGESIAVAQKAEEVARVPVLSLAASRQIVWDERLRRTRHWVFKFAQNDSLAAERLLREMVRTGKRTVALLYSDDGFGKSGADEFRELVKNTNIVRLVHDQSFPKSLDQPEPLVASIPLADAILVWGTAPGPSLIVKALRERQTRAQIYLSHGNATEDFIRSTGPASEGVVLVGSRVFLAKFHPASSPEDEAIVNFDRYWRQQFGTAPSHFGGHAWDAYDALQQTRLQGARTPSEVRDKLESLTNFQGVTGTFHFSTEDHAGLGLESFATYKIQSGAFVPIDTP
jgi:branched-chain amino acid transport system substrate-binding protein